MSLARAVITAVDGRGPLQERGRPRLRRLPVLGPAAGQALRGRGRGRVHSRGPDDRTPTRRRSAWRWRTRSSGSARTCPSRGSTPARRPSGPTSRHRRGTPGHGCRVGLDDLAGPDPPRVRHPPTAETTPGVVAPVRRRAAQRTLAGRHHPLAARRRHRRGDPQHPRRPLPARPGVATPAPHHHRPRRRRHLPRRVPPLRASPPACSPTTARSSPATAPRRPGRARDRTRPASASGSTTPGPTTPRPAGRSNGSTRPRRSGSPPNPPPATIAELQRQLDRFRRYYNTVRPHRALDRTTPAQAYNARPKATPTRPIDPGPLPSPPRQDRHERHHHHPLQQPTPPHRPRPRTRRHTTSWSSSHDLYIRVVDADTGELLRELTLDPTRTTNPSDRPPRTPTEEPLKCNDVPRHLSTVSRDITHGRADRI